MGGFIYKTTHMLGYTYKQIYNLKAKKIEKTCYISIYIPERSNLMGIKMESCLAVGLLSLIPERWRWDELPSKVDPGGQPLD